MDPHQTYRHQVQKLKERNDKKRKQIFERARYRKNKELEQIKEKLERKEQQRENSFK